MAEFSHPVPDLHEQLEQARSAADVADACDEFLSRFTPARLQALPSRCRPPERLDPEQISAYAVELVRADLAQGSQPIEPLRTFARFFSDAAACIARIAMARGRQDGWAYVDWRR